MLNLLSSPGIPTHSDLDWLIVYCDALSARGVLKDVFDKRELILAKEKPIKGFNGCLLQFFTFLYIDCRIQWLIAGQRWDTLSGIFAMSAENDWMTYFQLDAKVSFIFFFHLIPRPIFFQFP